MKEQIPLVIGVFIAAGLGAYFFRIQDWVFVGFSVIGAIGCFGCLLHSMFKQERW